LPAVPTFAEAGLPGYEAYTWHMVLAPAGTPAEVVGEVNAAANRLLEDPRLRRRLEEQTMQVRAGGTPEAAAAWLQAEMTKWEAVIRTAGITAQ
jgi:tripartite-type tricarboxylate transporter receptor subunit TctC